MDDFSPDPSLTPEQNERLKIVLARKAAAQQKTSDDDIQLNPEQQKRLDDVLARRDPKKLFNQNMQQQDSMLKGAGQQTRDSLRDVVQGAVSSVPKLGQSIASVASHALPDSWQQSNVVKDMKNFDWDKFTSAIGSGKNTSAARTARGIGSYLPYGAAEKAVAAPLSILGKYLATGGAAAASSLVNDKASGKDALLNGLVNVVFKGGFDTAEWLRPSNRLRSNLSPDELKENLEAAKGTNTSIGRVLQSPTLTKGYENVLTATPFSGAKQGLQDSVNQVKGKANSLAEQLLGSTDPETLNNTINQQGESALKNVLGLKNLEDSDAQLNNKGKGMLARLFGEFNPKTNMSDLNNQLNDIYSSRNDFKKSIYNDVEDEADATPKFKMSAPEFEDSAYSAHPNVYNSLEPEFKDIYDKLAGKSKTKPFLNAQTGIIEHPKNEPVSLKQANLLKARLNQLGNLASTSPDMVSRASAGSFKNIASKIDRGISDSIENSDNPVLKKKFETAQTNYGKNYAPFLDKDIYKYIGGKADPDKMISDLLSTGKHEERSTRLSKLSSLSPQLQKTFAKSYFNRSFNGLNNEISHKDLGRLVDELGSNQMDSLVPSQQAQRELRDYSNTSKVYQHFGKTINGDGTINHDFLTKKIQELKKNPAQFKKMIPSDTTRKQLADYSTLHQKRKDFMSAIDSDGNVSPAKFSTLTEKLAKNIDKYNDYVPDKSLRESLSNFRTLQKMNVKNPMFNPDNGQTNRDLLGLGAMSGMSGTGATAGGAIGGLPGAVIGAVLAPALAVGGGRYLAKKAVSPDFRERLVNEILTNKNKFSNTKKEDALKLILQGHLQQQSGGQ